jgi:tRNA dimethylallyltransferase
LAEGSAPLLVLTGITAVGKTELALALGEALGAEVVSADSAMVYRGLDVGTAKPSPEERARVPHHVVDVRDPTEPFSVAEYRALAEEALRDVRARGRVPLLVGGTGLYVRQVVEAPELPPVPPQPALRALWEARARAEGPEAVHAALRERDPVAAARIHPHNVRRVIRALEVLEVTGRPETSFWRPGGPRIPAVVVVLDRPPRVLEARVRARVRAMLERGLVEEVQGLLARGVPPEAQAMQAVGYKETVAWLRAGAPPGVLEETLVRATLRFAKRQRTWWRAVPWARWLDLGEAPAAEAQTEVLRLWRAGA